MEKKKWIQPEIKVQQFMPNEYVSTCGYLSEDTDTVIYFENSNITVETAWNRTPAGQEGYVMDDIITSPRPIYMGAFFLDKEMTIPDSTATEDYRHIEHEDFGAKCCVRESDKSPWGYHYHFIKVTNHS